MADKILARMDLNDDELRVTEAVWKGRTYIQVRKWYKDGAEWKPGREGFAMLKTEWHTFFMTIGEADDNMGE